MPSIASGSPGQRYACKCLNIRMQSAPPPTPPPESVDDPAYSQVYVGDEGIEVKHPQLTLRSRLRVAAVPGTNRYSRFTTLTCLLCDLPAYRVFQTVPADVEGKDGPVLPAEDWVEKETMKSSNGWIEIHNDALTGDTIIHAEANATYSSLFNLLVPHITIAPPRNPQRVKPNSSREPSPAPEPSIYLSGLKALFPPPPFTPSHPAFLHLAALAEQETKARREAAEKYISDVVKQKTEEIEQGDAALRQQVEALWRKFRESVKKAHGDHHHAASASRSSVAARSSRSSERDNSRTPFARNSSPAYGTPIAIRDFVPVSVPERRRSSPPQRQSALSASLATTSFHHPRASQGHSPQSEPSGSPDSTSSRTLSTRSGSATLVQPTVADSINVLQFRRNFDDTINTQASYRYFQKVEEDMARDKERRLQAAKANGKPAGTSTPGETSAPAANGKPRNGTTSVEHGDSQASKETPKPAKDDPPTPSRGRDPKGKRKVTFDVEPEVVAIKRGTGTEASTPVAAPTDQQDPREMIFDLEDMEGDKSSSPRIAQALPLLEPPAVLRPLRPGKAKAKGLPESFAGLRPVSLPNPSHIRPLRSQPGVDSSRATLISLPHAPGIVTRRGSEKLHGTKSPTREGKENDSDAELRGLVDMPSQRGAWSPDGRIWHSFTRGHPVTSNVIMEENESETGQAESHADPTTEAASISPVQQIANASISSTEQQESRRGERDIGEDQEERISYGTSSTVGVPGSLPVHIHLKTKPREVLSLASYQPQHAMPQDEPGSTEPAGKAMSTTAIRKAMYAERDRTRSVDPGTLDLLEEEEDEEDEDEDELDVDEEEKARIKALLSTSRGRKQALKILQTANKLPEAGMWRSLAS